ncbi:metallophosphoesterase [Extibacter muris]|uniref:metallophosphoesterase n=1 Tax=Extibacter muris TaxID=1796622 RepID=UPI001D082442|nr:metallophosphoesterase [Extibacter muris]MCB6200357.1 metallophosphoesterase [Extibacter muris]MCQ4663750.1 metallophosphoesterase [Extibacter muris]MCQ4693941.1 metallophosphoesterase [Extibacter muris]
MIAVFLAPVYILLNIYVFCWLIRWMGACTRHFKKRPVRAAVLVVYSFFALSILLSFFWPVRWLKTLTNIWFGTVCYILLTVAAADLIRIILKYVVKVDRQRLSSRRTFVTAGTVCIAVILSVSVYGFLNGKHIRTTEYDVAIDKDAGDIHSMKVVLTADLHLGYNTGNYEMEQMVKKINAQDPDLVVIAGDFFDNDFDALDDPDKIAATLRGIKSSYGVYACYGNHDVQEKILAGFTFNHDEKKVSDPRMDQFLADSNITLLRDEGVLVEDSFYLYGRADEERPGRGIDERRTAVELTEGMDMDKPVIVIDHEPKELDELAQAGVDLDLCGHTHDGQMFPGNVTIKLMWENAYGYLKKGKMHNIVTSGVGVFGPNMRVGTKSEICAIDVSFR